jgi:DNA polymerase III subunit epsilon
MYAIVDIETTGSYAAANGITEVSIITHDGEKITDRYQTLINPGTSIPVYITALTGINDEMVSNAPSFEDVAEEIYDQLKDKIFVAHSVHFDYSFLKHQLEYCGYTLQNKKLCTVRLSRKIFPGLTSYSLGKLCASLHIPISDRHRAGGDSEATAILFSMLLENDRENHFQTFLNRNSKEQQLPDHLPKEQVSNLPSSPGVYYFKDHKGKVIYVGKAKSIKKRVFSHFTGTNSGRQRQEFLKNIHSISYEECGTELMAFIMEATEIRRLWPANNRALKRFEQKYGLYAFEDQKGYLRLTVDKHKKYFTPLHSFNNLLDGHNLLTSLVKEFGLCPKLCFIQRNNYTCTGIENDYCKGACENKETAVKYNKRVQKALEYLRLSLPSFVLKDSGRSEKENSYLVIEEGKFIGMGYVPHDTTIDNLTELKKHIQPYPSNDYILNLILSHADLYPEKAISY